MGFTDLIHLLPITPRCPLQRGRPALVTTGPRHQPPVPILRLAHGFAQNTFRNFPSCPR